MTILFISKSDQAGEWREALVGAGVDMPVVTPEDDYDPADIRYAIVWKPPAALMAPLVNLKAVFNLGAGVDAIVGQQGMPRDVPLCRLVDPGLTEAMTEFVVWRVVEWHRKADAYRAHDRAGKWVKEKETLARQHAVLMLGLGELGGDAAQVLRRVGFRMLGWSRTLKEIEGLTCYAGQDGLRQAIGQADVIVCLLPLTVETRHLLNADLFAAARPGAYLINAGRGALLREEDLIPALDRGHLSGAALDVFETEPLPEDHPFWADTRIRITPHVASVTFAVTAGPVIAQQIKDCEAGRPLRYVVDYARGY